MVSGLIHRSVPLSLCVTLTFELRRIHAVDEQMPVRGGDGTVEVLGSIVHMPPEESK